MNACERGNWIDTEGWIQKKMIGITQEERQPLEDYCEGAKRDGVRCKVTPPMNKRHVAYITGAENIAKEITLTEGCIRTKKKHQQIEAFKNYLKTAAPDPRITRARKTLGI